MDLWDSKAFTRRAFIHRGLTLASAAVTVPAFLQRSAFALAQPGTMLSSRPGVKEDRILVVVQLAGGNDGLNTVIPFEDDSYYRARPRIAVPKNEVLALAKGNGAGLHPRLTGLKELFDDGMVSIVQGVGYPNPNRSHFKSMDIWHTADTTGTGDGWIGRYFDNQCSGKPGSCASHSGVAIGRDAPLAMQGRTMMPVSFESEKLFRWAGLDLDPALEQPFEQVVQAGDKASADPESSEAFLMRTALDAHISSQRIREAVSVRPLVQYPRSGLARELAMVAAMIRAGLETRVYYVSLGGFDTHAGQGGSNGRHANLLQQFGDAVNAFMKDLKAQGNDSRVLVMTFSEFGRRVGQNGSGGTDHGTAAPMFLMGPMVRPGVIGEQPSLTSLDEGDLKYAVDFRHVYASVLEDWLKADSQSVLGKAFRPAAVIRG